MNHSKVVLTDRILSQCTGGSDTLIGLLNFSPLSLLVDSTLNQINVIGNNNAVASGLHSTAVSVNIENVNGGDAPMWATLNAITAVGLGLLF